MYSRCGAGGELNENRFAVSNEAAELGSGQNRMLPLSIQGMDCPSYAHKVTTALLTIPSVRVNTCTGRASLKEGLIEPGKISKRTAELTGYACVVDPAQVEGRHRILHIALSTVVGSSDKVPKLPLGGEILNTSCTASGTVLDVQLMPL